MKRIIESILSLFPYVKSLKAQADTAKEVLEERTEANWQVRWNVQERNRALKAEIESLKAYIESLEEYAKSRNRRSATKQRRYIENLRLKAEIESLKADAEFAASVIDDLQKDRESRLTLVKAVAKLEAENGNLVEALHLRVTELASLKAKNESLEAALDESETFIWEQLHGGIAYGPTIEMKDSQIESLKAQLAKAKARMRKAQRRAAKNRSNARLWNEFTNITLAQTAGFLSEN